MKKQLPKLIVVCGPTATGKSDLAVRLARKFQGEVISADSRQVYKGLDIGSGKITKKEMKKVPHHLLDVVSPKRIYSVDDFKNDSKRAVDKILSNGNIPIVCGGTGFYIDALVYDVELPNVPPDRKLRNALAKKSEEKLMKIITKIDPRRARSLDPKNKVRIIRAIEIARTLGYVPRVKRKKAYETLWIGLETDREELRLRIHGRLLKRMANGMIDEVKNLKKMGISWKRLFSLGLEYRNLGFFLQGKMTKADMIRTLEKDIFEYSKRQMTWFKNNKEIIWYDLRSQDKIEKKVAEFLKESYGLKG